MKHFSYTVVAIAAFVLTTLSGCTSEEPDLLTPGQSVQNGELTTGSIDYEFVRSFCNGERNVTFKQTDVLLYNNDFRTGYEWKVSGILCGHKNETPEIMFVQDGYVYVPIFTTICNPYQDFTGALAVLNVFSKTDYQVFVGNKIQLSEPDMKIFMDGASYLIHSCSENNLLLHSMSSYVTDFEGKLVDGKLLEAGFYTIDTERKLGETNLAFKSYVEAYDWLIEEFRNAFGDEVNQNEIITYNILNDPYIYLKDLVAERNYFESISR